MKNGNDGSRPWSALDGYRAIAIVVVMLAHARFSAGYPAWMSPLDPFIRGGVTAFMVLSGYLVTRSLLHAEARTGCLGIPAFLAGQAVRFYVPALGYLAAVLAIWGWRPGFDWEGALRVLWMAPRTAAGPMSTFHLYSLAAQMQFCLWWPLLLRMMPRHQRFWPATALALAAVVWRWAGTRMAWDAGETHIRTDFVYAGLLVGAWWAVSAVEGRMDWIARLPRRRVVPVVAVSLVVLVFTRSPTAFVGMFSTPWRDAVLPWREVAALAFLVRVVNGLQARLALGCLAFLLHNQRPRRLARALAWPGLAWLGRISFSVYLWQNVFCFGLTGTPFDRFPLNLGASVACGAVAYALIEKPSLRWRHRLKQRLQMPRQAKAGPGKTLPAGAPASAPTPDPAGSFPLSSPRAGRLSHRRGRSRRG